MPGQPLSVPEKALGLVRQRTAKLDPGLVLYNSFSGHFSDNPRAIYEELLRRALDLRHVWLAQPGKTFPPEVATVSHGEASYFRDLGSAAFVITNQAMHNYRPRRAAKYVQTWHGTPLKRVGFDNPQNTRDPKKLAKMERDWNRWDFFVSPNSFSTDIFRQAFGYDGEVLETGYPRNDILNSPERHGIRDRVRQELGIADDVRAVLFAPTFRDDDRDADGNLVFRLELDLERMAAALPGHVVLLRLHHWVASRVGDLPPGFCIDVSAHADIRDLYLAADALVTDYSSVMFDFAVTGKPIVYFMPDMEHYRDVSRGFYFDITEEAPGPLCTVTDEVIEAFQDLPDVTAKFGGAYERFRAKFCHHDDGGASRRVVDRIFGS